MTTTTTRGPDLTGLTAGPGQTWGAVRLVPLLRDTPVTDLRLHARLYDPDDLSLVAVTPRVDYVAYVPHAFVADWTSDGTPAAAYGTQLRDPADDGHPDGIGLTMRRRMARREERRRLRFLPMHLALEGFLALQFGGPPVVWQEWTRRAVVQGLSPRTEAAYRGAEVAGLADALRVFEIHPGQCGMLLYVADALAAAFVVPHPDDYRALHPTLLQDLYGELVHQYAHFHPEVPGFRPTLDTDRVSTVADLRAELARTRAEWSAFTLRMADGLLGVDQVTSSRVHRMGRFTLSRFLPAFDPDGENHIGETITDGAGRLAYLKSFRLSAAQARRGHLLSRLAAADWNLDATAAALGTDRQSLVLRLDRAGFGDLLRPEIIDAARRRAREQLRPTRRTR
ncbi:ARPP-2 domain-containing protein [Plantactinospora sonchi]|uniref:ARG and Rhodanese-Phosphatase-superfamily-associated domain-containing protein n=1 Tax=Plantactinospora sonchi TaxID=1544735 RepID=A0ABU7RQR2_9ACTN